MQTRKRAKSVTFGKKHKEKEPAKKAEKEEVVTAEAEKEAQEKKESHEKQQFELSETLPKNEPEEEKVEEKSAVETPASEFVSDSPLSSTPELPKNSKEEASVTPAEHTEVTPAAVTAVSELSQPVEPTASTVPEQQAQQPQEGDSNLPPSAFTIQSNEQPAAVPPTAVQEGGKKRFGVYFFVVAFLSFILGFGVMAVASYYGLFNSSLSKLPSNGILGQKPTSTVPQPVVKPTEKPVDITAFTISLLNGSGISGKAADEKTALTTAGFKVTSTGNADTSDFTQTKIAAKKSVDPVFLTKLEAELKKTFDVDTSVTFAPATASADVIITLGKSPAK